MSVERRYPQPGFMIIGAIEKSLRALNPPAGPVVSIESARRCRLSDGRLARDNNPALRASGLRMTRRGRPKRRRLRRKGVDRPRKARNDRGVETQATCVCGAAVPVESGMNRFVVCPICGTRLIVRPTRLSDDAAQGARALAAPEPEGEMVLGISEANLRQKRRLARPEDFGYADRSPHAAMSVPSTWKPFLLDIAAALLMLTDPLNLLSFLMLFVMLGGCSILVIFVNLGFALFLLPVGGLYCAYLARTVELAAAGEQELPSGVGVEDLWASIFAPLIRFLVASGLAALPAVIYVAALFSLAARQEAANPADPALTFRDVLMGAVSYGAWKPLWDTFGLNFFILVLLAGLGAAAWPMLFLVVTLGSYNALLHLPLMGITMKRTLLAYGVAVVFMLLSVAFKGLALSGFQKWAGGMPLHKALLLCALLVLLDTYLTLVAMRVIGLYYRHFKSRFAWSWG